MKINEEVEMTVDEFKKILESENGIYEIETPNGWVEINEFYDRGEKESAEIFTKSGSLKCSLDHLLFTENGEWKKVENLSVGDKVRKKDSIECIDKIINLGKIQVYDLWINSVEHAYYSNDFISHNCGKTELAKTLAKELGIGMTKLDMSEYKEEYSVSKLIGSAPGYVGYEQSGALTEPVIKNPNQIILLDEIEKAHSAVYDLLLQVMDEGRLTDNHGREANFKNAIILMTSNVGCANAEDLKSQVGFVKSDSNEKERKSNEIKKAFEKTFTPEFRGRITNVFYFNPVNKEMMGMIVDKNIRNLQELLKDKNIQISITDKAREYFVNKAMKENAGGRPVERIINSEVTEKISDEILFGKLSDEKGGKVSVGMNNDKIVVKVIENHE